MLIVVVSSHKAKALHEGHRDWAGSLSRRCLSAVAAGAAAVSRRDWNTLMRDNSSVVEVVVVHVIEVLEEHHQLHHLAHVQQ
jgi:hypothetical protein